MIWSFLTPKFRVLIAATDFEPGDFIFREKELVVRKDSFNNNLALNIRFVDLEKSWILSSTTFGNHVYWLSRWVRVKQHLQSASAVDEECQERWDQKEKVKVLKEASKIRKWRWPSFKIEQNQKVKMWNCNISMIRSGVLAVPGQYVPSVVPSWNQRSNIQSFARS